MSSRDDDHLVVWRSSPSGNRGTYDIISLCVSTLVICAWNAVHLDAPRLHSFTNPLTERVVWFLIGIFMPELLLMFAIAQNVRARGISAKAYELGFPRPKPSWVQSILSKIWASITRRKCSREALPVSRNRTDATRPLRVRQLSPHGRKQSWTLTHSFYVIMGGFESIGSADFELGSVSDLRSELPDVSVKEIMDRSKSGPLSKAILCAQILFFCANCVARINQRLPLSLLEITTIGHALCALGAYVAWWHKPQDVGGLSSEKRKNLLGVVWDSMENYGEGNLRVPLSRNIVPASALIAVLYGLPHLLGLHIRFPTIIEHNLWLASTVLIISILPLASMGLLVMEIVGSMEIECLVRPVFWLVYLMWLLLTLVFPVASTFLMCESIRQIFALPEAAFSQPQWTKYIPHFS